MSGKVAFTANLGLAARLLASLALLYVLYVFLAEPLWMVPVLEKLTPNILYRVKMKERLVALTFDDGPNAEFTPQVLELLRQNDAHATFFFNWGAGGATSRTGEADFDGRE